MARRKGKSRRRVKDWHQRFAAGEDLDAGAARQRLGKQGVKLPDRDLDAGQEDTDDLPRARGMVVGLFPGGVEVRVGQDVLLCQIAKTFRAPEGATALAVGDRVTVALARPEHVGGEAREDKDRSDGMILTRELRETVLARPRPRSGKRRDEYRVEIFEKVVAANMDVLLIVVATCQPPLRPGLIDRFLIVAERGELTPVIAFNKTDLAPVPDDVAGELAGLDVDAVSCSAVTGEGLEALTARLAGHRSVLAGASGVGKSTLINALIPGAQAVTRSVRSSDDRGRHTTSASSVYDLPGGGILVDTPGIRELALHMDAHLLPWYFPDFEAPAADCKFGDCTHTHEPGCAVQAAVEAGVLPLARYRRYLRLVETLADG